jgi:hypothetical protein
MRDPEPRTGTNGAGAKHGTMSSSNIARVTGSDACLSAAGWCFAAIASGEEEGGTDMVGSPWGFACADQAAAMTWISIL